MIKIEIEREYFFVFYNFFVEACFKEMAKAGTIITAEMRKSPYNTWVDWKAKDGTNRMLQILEGATTSPKFFSKEKTKFNKSKNYLEETTALALTKALLYMGFKLPSEIASIEGEPMEVTEARILWEQFKRKHIKKKPTDASPKQITPVSHNNAGSARFSILPGFYSGTIKQGKRTDKGHLILLASSPLGEINIQGDLIVTYEEDKHEGPRTEKFKVSGRYLYDQNIELFYSNIDETKKQCGTISLTLSGNSKILSGVFTGRYDIIPEDRKSKIITEDGIELKIEDPNKCVGVISLTKEDNL